MIEGSLGRVPQVAELQQGRLELGKRRLVRREQTALGAHALGAVLPSAR